MDYTEMHSNGVELYNKTKTFDHNHNVPINVFPEWGRCVFPGWN